MEGTDTCTGFAAVHDQQTVTKRLDEAVQRMAHDSGKDLLLHTPVDGLCERAVLLALFDLSAAEFALGSQ